MHVSEPPIGHPGSLDHAPIAHVAGLATIATRDSAWLASYGVQRKIAFKLCPDNLVASRKGNAVLTEQEVNKSWRQLFSRPPITEDTFAKAEALIEELRAESPLRHRLGGELKELRKMHAVALKS